MRRKSFLGRISGRHDRAGHGVALPMILVLWGLAAAWGAQAQPGAAPASKAPRISAREAGRPAAVRSAGATGAFFRLRDVRPGARVEFELAADDVALLYPESIRLFRWDDRGQRWMLIENAKYDPGRRGFSAPAAAAGLYTAFGASRFEPGLELQKAYCLDRTGRFVPKICQLINCPAEGLGDLAGEVADGVPGTSPRAVAARMGGLCEQCLGGPLAAADFPECAVPGVRTGFPVSPALPILWPARCFEAGRGCTPGGFLIGQVDYDFEDDFDLIPTGSVTPAYPDVDVRATVRYPATAAGTGKPVAGTARYPLVVFLHGNHATCPCSCSHACAKPSRVPNHLGYNYLLDILASHGFIAVSIDGFDVTCAGSFAMSDYEARGRLVLKHLERWKDWDLNGTDPWSGLFKNRVNMNSIGLSGHSRGGEGVVAAEFINRAEGLGYQIKAVNAIAPTDQDPSIHYVPQVPYFLLIAASDGDVSNLQGLRTYDRTSLAAAPAQSEKSMLWVYGANHNFFNVSWTPSSGIACASDDGAGDGRLSDSLQRLVGCQSIVPFFRLHLQGQSGFRKLFLGETPAEGLDGVEMYWTFQSPTRREVDSFDSGDNPATNSLAGAVTTSGGFSTFDEFEFKPSGADLFNSSFRHFTHGLVLGWSSNQTYETALPAGQRDVTGFTALALRVSQILDGNVLNPLDTPRTLRVRLKTGAGTVSDASFDLSSMQSVPFPYEYNGGKSVLGMIRIPLSSFRTSNTALPLNDIAAVILELRGTGLIAIDDIQFTR